MLKLTFDHFLKTHKYVNMRLQSNDAFIELLLMQLSSKDPILTAFELSWQLKRLSFLEPEFKNEYLELRRQCQSFATSLLDHTRTTNELEVYSFTIYRI